jgi:hypothetical protein
LDDKAQTLSYENYYPYGGTDLIAGKDKTQAQQKLPSQVLTVVLMEIYTNGGEQRMVMNLVIQAPQQHWQTLSLQQQIHLSPMLRFLLIG